MGYVLSVTVFLCLRFSVTLVKAIPVLGNLFSAGLAVRDVVHGIQDYQACLAGH